MQKQGRMSRFEFVIVFLVLPRLPLRGSWRGAPERARPLMWNRRHSDSLALTKALLIAARCLCITGLALSVCCADTSPRGRGFGRPQGAKTPFRRWLLREGRGIWRSFKLSAYHRRKSNFVRVANFGSAGEVRTSPIRGTSPSWRTINIKLYIVYFIELRHLFYYSEGTNTIGYVHLAGEGSSSRLRLTW